ncbi:uncharacterized protein LOC133192872 [Saccostrea echinata]|uniref:uncharacterized protein LOC133192872 n=1 Tax=Saccostrea echinata TaxID=191078 RepID=UPI002A8255FC|nr:uncharacterized protein LOC133192872 [Saccostrea echinata]
MRFIFIALSVLHFNTFADICRSARDCSFHCHNNQAQCSFGHCVCQAISAFCSSNNDCSSQCHNGEHPHCSHHGGGSFCRCYECLTDSECFCPHDETGKCHQEFSFGTFRSHYCQCQVQSTTTATSTTTISTTTTMPLAPLECNGHKISVIESIAENIHVEDSRASLCPSNNKHQSSEAFVIHKCNTTERTSWMQGLSVKSSCKNIQPYTPVATFFENSNDMAGFFIGCTDSGNGFTIAAQTCSDAPMILTLNETTTPRMSDFYTIKEWKPA